MGRLGAFRDRLANVVTGVDVSGNVSAFQDLSRRVDDAIQVQAALVSHVQSLRSELAELHARVRTESETAGRNFDLNEARLRFSRDDINGLRASLQALRSSPEHLDAIDCKHPLVTVRIASYQDTDALINIAIPSVLAQTYDNFEIVIVNDGPNDRTRHALEALADSRIRYFEFPFRHHYPADRHWRWMVAGSPGMNRGAELAAGTWIAPLDEDDEFTVDHLEKLVALASERRVELAYGALIQQNLVNGDENRIYSDPPAISQFSFQGAIYLARLHPIFSYDEESWMVGEPGDWNLIRRMSAAGVTMASTPDIVATMRHIPYTHKERD